MSPNGFANIITTLGAIAIVTTLVLPKRETANVLKAGGTAGSGLLYASLGIVPGGK